MSIIGQLRNRTALGRLNSTECEKIIQVMAELGYGQGDGPSNEVVSRLSALVAETKALVAKPKE